MIRNEGFSFIIPAYNSRANIANTLKKLNSSIIKAKLSNFEIIVVDDGSSDGTSDLVMTLNYPNLQILKLENSGRLVARLNGLHASSHDNIFFIDSRVELDEFAIVNILNSRITFPEECGMVIPKIVFAKSNLVGLFWDAIARIVWFRYYKNENNVILTEKNFDDYPKGSGFLYAKKKYILEAYGNLTSIQLESKDTNDDTLIIRYLASRTVILLCKSSHAFYLPRTDFREFLLHARHRGKVAGDGFFARGTKGRKLFYMTVSLISLILILSGFYPNLLLALLGGFLIFEVVVLSLVRPRHFLSLNVYAVPFLFVYALGVIASTIAKRKTN